MKFPFWLPMTVLTVLGFGVNALGTSAIAATFDTAEVESDRFVLMAAPVGSGGAQRIRENVTHQLVIVEQLNDSRPCWREHNGNPALVDPLLLEFDFTGICGRSADSNAYSIRTAGEDLGRQYSLRIVERQGDLVLVALTREDPFHPIEIGRTRDTTENFSRIDLQPGWRLTRRMYNGEPLGHLYLTNEQSLQALLAASPRWSALSPPAGANVSEPSVGRVESAPDTEPTTVVPDLFRRTPESDANTSEPSASEGSEVVPDLFRRVPEPETDSEPSAIRIEVTEPEVEGAEPEDTASGAGAIAPTTEPQQLPVPDDLPPTATAETPETSESSSEAGRREVEFRQNPAPQGANSQPVNPPSSELPLIFINPSPLPSGSSTPNNPSPNSPNSPPPSPSDLANAMGFSFRVIVEADSPDTQERVREIVPDAFRTTLDGKTVIQAGLFYSRDEANALQQQLIQANLRAMVVSIN